MNFDYLQSLMLKTAKDFDKAASTEPTIDSEENGTQRGDDLDQVLAAQKAERDSLWKELHELEEKQRSLKETHVFGGVASPDRKHLMMLRYEEIELSRERHKQENDISAAHIVDDKTISDLQFKERLQRSVKEMGQLVSYLKEQLTDAKASHQRELRCIDESQQVQDALTNKIRELEMDGVPSATQRNREKMMKARQVYQMVIEYLMEFLGDHYPPHLNDGISVFNATKEDLCDLKYIIEELMDRSILNPSDPYIDLQDGKYWSPYIETLVKGNIAQRHPENSKRLKLVDFRIYP